MLREVYPYQILSLVHLSYRMGEMTLREWIESSEDNGVLRDFTHKRWLWEIPENKLNAVRRALAKNNLLTLYLPDMSRILESYAKPHGIITVRLAEQPDLNLSRQVNLSSLELPRSPDVIGNPYKQVLLEKLKTMGIEEANFTYNGPYPLVTLEDFFEGNDDHYSIAPNLDNAELFTMLKAIRSRADVQNVLIEIDDASAGFQNTDAWPQASRVFFYTSAQTSEVYKWNEQLQADGAIKVNSHQPKCRNTPILNTGNQIWYCVWD